ncbi:hypothetical protein Trydic_g19674 [Trypoxylus dichotomus]
MRHEGLLLEMKDCGLPAIILKTVTFQTVVSGSGPSASRMESVAHLANIQFFCPGGLKINAMKMQVIVFTRIHQKLQRKITVTRIEQQDRKSWSDPKINFLTFSNHLKRVRNIPALHIRLILIYANPTWFTAAPGHIVSLVRVQNHCLGLIFHVLCKEAGRTESSIREDLEEFLKRLNRERITASGNPALKSAITQKIW